MSRVWSDLRIVLCVCVLLAGQHARAGDGAGKVLEMAINKDLGSVVFVRLDAAPASPAACSIHGHWHFTLPLTSDIDKKMYAMLVGAQLSGRSVSIGGTGACSDFHNVESARAIGM